MSDGIYLSPVQKQQHPGKRGNCGRARAKADNWHPPPNTGDIAPAPYKPQVGNDHRLNHKHENGRTDGTNRDLPARPSRHRYGTTQHVQPRRSFDSETQCHDTYCAEHDRPQLRRRISIEVSVNINTRTPPRPSKGQNRPFTRRSLRRRPDHPVLFRDVFAPGPAFRLQGQSISPLRTRTRPGSAANLSMVDVALHLCSAIMVTAGVEASASTCCRSIWNVSAETAWLSALRSRRRHRHHQQRACCAKTAADVVEA